MPEEDLVYKVTLDTSAIAGKLEELKNNISMAFGTGGFIGTTPDVRQFEAILPQAPTGFIMPRFPDIGGMATSISSKFFDTTTETFLAGRDLMSNFAEGVSRAMDASRFGFTRFRGDLQTVRDMTVADRGIVDGVLPNMQEKSIFGLIAAEQLGIGYDPDMAISRGKYQQWARASLVGDRFPELVGLGTGTAAAIGTGALLATTAINPVVGIAATIAAGFIAGEGPPLIGATFRRDVGRAKFIQGTSWRFESGQFDTDQAMGLSRRLNEVIQSRTLRLEGIDRTEAETTLGAFTEAGGFDSVRNAEEYAQRFETLLTNVQRVRHILHTTLEGATRAMARWQELGLLDDAGPLQFGLGLGAQAKVAGFTTREIMGLGEQGAAMVRGTGIALGAGFQGAIDIATNVKMLQREDQIGQETIRQIGGVGAAALTLERIGVNYAMSPMSMGPVGAIWGGVSPQQVPQMGFMQQMQAGSQIFDTPANYFQYRYDQADIMSEMGVEWLTGMQKLEWAREFDVIAGGGGPHHPGQFAMYLMETKGLSREAALTMAATSDVTTSREMLYQKIRNVRQQAASENYGWWNITKANIAEYTVVPIQSAGNWLSYQFSNLMESETARGVTDWYNDILYDRTEIDRRVMEPIITKYGQYDIEGNIDPQIWGRIETEVRGQLPKLRRGEISDLSNIILETQGAGLPGFWGRRAFAPQTENFETLAQSEWFRGLSEEGREEIAAKIGRGEFNIAGLRNIQDPAKQTEAINQAIKMATLLPDNMFDFGTSSQEQTKILQKGARESMSKFIDNFADLADISKKEMDTLASKVPGFENAEGLMRHLIISTGAGTSTEAYQLLFEQGHKDLEEKFQKGTIDRKERDAQRDILDKFVKGVTDKEHPFSLFSSKLAQDAYAWGTASERNLAYRMARFDYADEITALVESKAVPEELKGYLKAFGKSSATAMESREALIKAFTFMESLPYEERLETYKAGGELFTDLYGPWVKFGPEQTPSAFMDILIQKTHPTGDFIGQASDIRAKTAEDKAVEKLKEDWENMEPLLTKIQKLIDSNIDLNASMKALALKQQGGVLSKLGGM